MIATIIGAVLIYSLATIIKDTHTVKQCEKWQRVWDDYKAHISGKVSEWDVTESYLTFCHEMVKEGLGKYVPSF
jgi:hypothetical protein|nr:MAG TPA: hypothetical protein [Caudoviricetes sp.]